VSIAGQAVDPSSVLCRFLDERLPERQQVAGEWDGQASRGVWPGIAVDCDRRGLGVAAELRIGLDLAVAPGYQDLLSFLPPDECEILLRGAGYTPAGHLAETGTTDPLLREWIRSWQPIALDDGQRSALAVCCHAAQMRNVAGPLRGYSVELRRSLVAGSGPGRAAAAGSAAVRALTHLWQGYLIHGRRQLASLGERVVLAPPLAAGYGVADLIVGRSLVEIKTVLEPAGRFGPWLNQLLGYVLLDWFDTFRLDTVAVYLGWQAKLVAIPLADLLSAASRGHPPSLEELRAKFRQEIQPDLDLTTKARLREQYPPPLTPAPPRTPA
jgi:hypothetical protein